MSKCLFCYGQLEEGESHFHASCARKFFGMAEAPSLPYSRDNMSELARRVIRASTSVTGVQAKMSLAVSSVNCLLHRTQCHGGNKVLLR